MRQIILMVFSLFLFAQCSSGESSPTPPEPQKARLTYIGLKKEANQKESYKKVFNDYLVEGFYHTMKIYGKHIHINTTSGIYRKSLETLDNTSWEQFALEQYPILDFAMAGNYIFATTPTKSANAILRSDDNGKSFKDITPQQWVYYNEGRDEFVYEKETLIVKLAINPHNNQSLAAVVWNSGIYFSDNFGDSWTTTQRPIINLNQNRYLAFSPYKKSANILYYAGEFSNFQSFLYACDREKEEWELLDYLANEDSCIHHLAHHPTNPDEMIYSAEQYLARSIDGGQTWKRTSANENYYYYKTVYDKSNPQIVYTAGEYRGHSDDIDNNTLRIFRSTDSGKNWEVYFEKELDDVAGIVDIELYKKKLFILTFTDGVYVLDVSGEV